MNTYNKVINDSLVEYNKILATMETINLENTSSNQFCDYYTVVYNMTSQFGDNLDDRLKLLKKEKWSWNFIQKYKERKKFISFGNLLIDDIIFQVKSWSDESKQFYQNTSEPEFEERIELKGLI